MRGCLVLLLLVAVAAPARAGLDCDDNASMTAIERFARTKARSPGEYDFLCVQFAAPALKPRIERACQTLLDRDGLANHPCVVAAAAAGFAKLGDHDIFTAIAKLADDPVDSAGGVGWVKTQLLAMMGDPRGAQVIVEMWKAAIPRAAAREKRKREMASWSGWRQRAAEALGTLGGPDDATFLEAQARATKDRHVAKACRAAAAAIAKRTAP